MLSTEQIIWLATTLGVFVLTIGLMLRWFLRSQQAMHREIAVQMFARLDQLIQIANEAKEHLRDASNWPPRRRTPENEFAELPPLPVVRRTPKKDPNEETDEIPVFRGKAS